MFDRLQAVAVDVDGSIAKRLKDTHGDIVAATQDTNNAVHTAKEYFAKRVPKCTYHMSGIRSKCMKFEGF